MSRKSDSNIIVLIILGIFGALWWIIESLWKLFTQIKSTSKTSPQIIDVKATPTQKSQDSIQREEINNKRTEEARLRRIKEEKRWEELKDKFSKLKEDDLIFDNSINHSEKEKLLREYFNYSWSEAAELLKTAERQATKAKLQKAKRDIGKKAFELYGGIPSDDKRLPIPDEVKQYVWQRDKGKCVKCGGQENLEFDHIIPFSKGGSSTERNIQLLCESCNRQKSDNIQ